MQAVTSNVVDSLCAGMKSIEDRAESGSFLLDGSVVPVLQAFAHAAMMLEEAAESVAAATGDPTLRDSIFDYRRGLREQREQLLDIVVQVLGGASSSPALLNRTLAAMRRIVDMTRSLVSLDEDSDLQKIQSMCKVVAGHARDLMYACREGEDHQAEVLDSARLFSSAAVSLVQLTDSLAQKYASMDLARSERLTRAGQSVRQLSVEMVGAVRACRAAPDDQTALDTLTSVTIKIARSLAAIATGGEEIARPSNAVPQAAPAESEVEQTANSAVESTLEPEPILEKTPEPVHTMATPADNSPFAADGADAAVSSSSSSSLPTPSPSAWRPRQRTTLNSPTIQMGSSRSERKKTISNSRDGQNLLRRARAATLADDLQTQLVRSLPSSPMSAGPGSPARTQADVPQPSVSEFAAMKQRVLELEAENQELKTRIQKIRDAVAIAMDI